jgi:molybdopterin-guanine dinucleotide biosynthesis protein A
VTGYDGMVLAGGRARRMASADKPQLVVNGQRLIDISVAALVNAATVVAVGPPVATARPVTWAREQPPGGGPVAAIAAGLPMTGARAVVVLAADLPFVTAAAVDALAMALDGLPAAVAVDADGRDQPLLGCYDVAALRAAIPADPVGASLRDVLAAIEATAPIRRVELHGDPPVSTDCDTEDDLHRARELA